MLQIIPNLITSLRLLLAIPISITIMWILKQNIAIKYFGILIIVSCIYLNIFQTFQKSNNTIHWDGMTKKAYWSNFHKLHLKSKEEWKTFQQQIQRPDYEKAKKGLDEYNFQPF